MPTETVTPQSILTAAAASVPDSIDPEQQESIARGRACAHPKAYKWENANLYHCPDCFLTAPGPEAEPCPQT